MISSHWNASFEVSQPPRFRQTYFGPMGHLLPVFYNAMARARDPGPPSTQSRPEVDRRSANPRNPRDEVRPLDWEQHLITGLTRVSIGDQFARWTSTSLDAPER